MTNFDDLRNQLFLYKEAGFNWKVISDLSKINYRSLTEFTRGHHRTLSKENTDLLLIFLNDYSNLIKK